MILKAYWNDAASHAAPRPWAMRFTLVLMTAAALTPSAGAAAPKAHPGTHSGARPSAAAASPIDWPTKLYNPHAAKGDVLVPMPCGGAMTFRAVGIDGDGSSTGPLRDRVVELGSDAEETGYAEYRRMAPIAGSFGADELGSASGVGDRSLLIGKYEVSTLQFAAVTAVAADAPCPEPSGRGRIPRGGVGWHDAIDFAHAWSLWLRQHAGSLTDCADSSAHEPCLPRVDSEAAFVRLPTDAEWEYVARGGDKVSPADFREPRFPMPEGMERYVWFSESAEGRIRPIGVLAPSPTGVHDILGNLEEIVLDPFQLRRLTRAHGQVGGYIVRGGSVHSGRSEVRASLRREVPIYDDRGAVATADTGLRVVLSAPVLTSTERLAAVREAWSHLGTDPALRTSAEDPAAMPTAAQPVAASADMTSGAVAPAQAALSAMPYQDPMIELSHLARVADDAAMAARLERLRGVIRASAERLHQQRARAAREALRFGGLLCQRLAMEGHNLSLRERRLELCTQNPAYGPEHPRCLANDRQLADDRKAFQDNADFYADTVIRTSRTYPDSLAVLQTELGALKDERIAAGADPRVFKYNTVFFGQVSNYTDAGRVRRTPWREACRALGRDLLTD